MTPNYFYCRDSLRWDNLKQNDMYYATYYCQKPETDSVFYENYPFWLFFRAFRGPGANILSRVAQKRFFLFLMFQAEKIRAKSYVTCHVFTQYQQCCRHCRKLTSRWLFWRIFVRRSKIFIPRFINIYIFELFTSF